MDSVVPDKVKKERSDALHKLSDEKKHRFYLENQGKQVNVLFESDNSKGFMHGFSENYLKVKTSYNPDFVNKVIKIKLAEPGSDGVFLTDTTA